jgi:hypothetical protein
MAPVFATLFHFHGTYSMPNCGLPGWACSWRSVTGCSDLPRTRHRAFFIHRWPPYFAALTAALFSHIFLKDPLVSWFAGLFMFGAMWST